MFHPGRARSGLKIMKFDELGRRRLAREQYQIPYRRIRKDFIMTRAHALNVVLVHGGFVDGAGWESVYNILKKDGYDVSVVQNPTLSLADDVAAARLAIA